MLSRTSDNTTSQNIGGDQCMGGPPHLNFWGGTSPQSPLGLRPCIIRTKLPSLLVRSLKNDDLLDRHFQLIVIFVEVVETSGILFPQILKSPIILFGGL